MIGTALLSGLLLMSGSHQPQVTTAALTVNRFDFTEMHMGVPFRISVYARDQQAANKAKTAAFARIAALNSVFSDYDSDSEVSRLRQIRAQKPVQVSADLAKLLARSLQVSRESCGAFDVTVGPLVRLWRRARRRKRLPEPEVLRDALARSGYSLLTLRGQTLTVRVEGMRLDFGAIAKGYACDEALAELRKHGITSALVDGGGDIAVSDPPPGRRGWRIQIEPENETDQTDVLLLKNQAVATSGDRYRFVELGGRRYSHIVDPRSGYGLTSRLTVTVVARTAADADAYASAVSVLGTTQGLRFIEARPGLEGRIRDFSKSKVVARSSQGLSGLILPE